MKDFVRLKSYASIMLAELDKNVLNEYGIISLVKNSGIEFPRDLGDSFGAELWVPQDQMDKAKEILDIK